MNRLGELGQHRDDPAAYAQFESLLTVPALRALLAPRMVTHGLTSVPGVLPSTCSTILTNTPPRRSPAPAHVTDNQTHVVSLSRQGKVLFDRLTCPKEFRLFTIAEGA